jgi:hypothetical protein
MSFPAAASKALFGVRFCCLARALHWQRLRRRSWLDRLRFPAFPHLAFRAPA